MKTSIKVLVPLVVAFCAVVISGCKDSAEATKEVIPTASNPASKEVVLFTWDQYIDPELVKSFTDETGIEVRIEHFESLSQMKGYLSSKPAHYDVVVADDFYMSELSELRLISPLDKASIPNIKNISEDFLDREFDPGNRYSVPYTWGSVLIAYRNDKIESPEHSWSLLWDKSLAGNIALLEDEEDIFALGLLASGYSPSSADKVELDEVTKLMVKHAKELRPKYLDLDDIRNQLDSGAISAALCYSGDAMVMADENENISCFIPSEGAALWIDNFAVVRDAPNRSNAHKFIDFMSRGEVAGQNASYLWTATPNKAALPFIDQETLDDTTVFLTPEMFAKCNFYARPTAARERITILGMKAIMDEVHLNIADQNLPE